MNGGNSIEIKETSGSKVPRSFEELTLAITLLVGLSTILLKTSNYFNSNIIDFNKTAFLIIYFIVVVLIIEIFVLFVFSLLEGYSLVAPPKIAEELKLKTRTDLIFRAAFSILISFIIYSVLLISYYVSTREKEVADIWANSILFIIAFAFVIPFFYLMGVDLKLVLSNKSKGFQIRDFKKLFRKKKDFTKELDKKLLSLDRYFIKISSLTFVVLLAVLVIFTAPLVLLDGEYNIEISQLPERNNPILTLTIEDTGIPSVRNFINLYTVNESNENLFQNIDQIVITKSNGTTSEFMSGKKKDGIYYLFINTTELAPRSYLVHSEVTMFVLENLITSKKYDNELFDLPASSNNLHKRNKSISHKP